jgi:hypothetical protein
MATETTTDQLEMDFTPPDLNPIQEILQQALYDDDDWRIKYTHSVIVNYLHLCRDNYEDAATVVDDIFAGFCGWSLSTLIIACLDDISPNDVDMMTSERFAYIKKRFAESRGGYDVEFVWKGKPPIKS